MSTRPGDTSAAAERLQRLVFARMSASDRAARAFEMAETARELARAGIRARHPDYLPAQVEQALRRLLLGDELVRKAWPASPLVDP